MGTKIIRCGLKKAELQRCCCCMSPSPVCSAAVPQAALSTPLTLDDIADISFTIATPSASRIGNDFGVDSATASQSVVDIRNYFPELWLFQLNAIE